MRNFRPPLTVAHETAAVHPWPNDDGISRKLAEQYRGRGWVDAIGLYGAAGRLPTWFRGHKCAARFDIPLPD